VLITILAGHERKKLTGEERKLHSSSHKDIVLTKSRRLRSKRHVAGVGKREGAYGALVGKIKE